MGIFGPASSLVETARGVGKVNSIKLVHSAEDAGVDRPDPPQLFEYLQTIQQGMVVWSRDGKCEHSDGQMLTLNELSRLRRQIHLLAGSKARPRQQLG